VIDIAGGEAPFAALTEPHRRELHVYCYRMLASFEEAEDAVQETLLRAWRSRDTFDGSSLLRAWLYRTLQRARATMGEHLPARRSDWTVGEPSSEERALLDQLIDAHERGDAALAISIAAQDLRITMPPYPHFFEELDKIGPLLANALREGDWRLVPTWANRMPTAASYLRQPGDTTYRAFKFDVLRIENGRIAEIMTFRPALFPSFGLALTH